MMNNLKSFVAGLKTAQVITLYNLSVETGKAVKKFADRKTAEGRMLKALAPNGQEDEYRAFVEKHGADAKSAGIELPVLEAPKPEANEEAPKKRGRKAAPRQDGDAPRKQNTPPHLNLRCPTCQYYAKSTPAMLKIARLICPVDPKHGKLLTAEERGEKRGR